MRAASGAKPAILPRMADTVIVTGASRGIGRALALAFAKEGHPLVVAARSGKELAALADLVREQHRVECLPVAGDLGTFDGRRQLEAACAGLKIQGLVNNAGFGTAGRFDRTDRERDTEMIRLNVEALTDLCHTFVPRLKQGPGAFLLNVASTASFQPIPLFAAYAATKAYVLSLSEALAHELEPDGVHVLALCPGATESGFQAAADVTLPQGAPQAEEVAAFALKMLAKKKRVAVHGGKSSFLAFSVRFAPRRMVLKSAERVMQPWFAGRPKS